MYYYFDIFSGSTISLSDPRGLAMSSDSTLYIADSGSNMISTLSSASKKKRRNESYFDSKLIFTSFPKPFHFARGAGAFRWLRKRRLSGRIGFGRIAAKSSRSRTL